MNVIESNVIDSIYVKIKTNELFGKRLCYCKDMILKEYLHRSKYLLVLLMQEFGKVVKEENYKIDFENIYGSLFEFKNFLCQYPFISKKVLTIFCEIEKGTKSNFLKFLKKSEVKLKQIKNDDEQIEFLENVFYDIIDWIEISIFNLISFNVSCDNYNNEVVKKQCDNKINNIDFCYHRDFINTKCDYHEIIEKKGEFIHIFLTKEVFPEFVNHYLEIFSKYYNGNLKNIDLVVDYSLIDNTYIMSEETYQRYLNLSKKMRNIYIINSNHIQKPANILEKIKNLPNIKFDDIPYPDLF